MSASRRVADGKIVTIAYRLTDDDGNLLDESTPENPFTYLHGEQQILKSLERAIEGQTPGFSKSIRLDAKEAYGAYKPELVVEVPRANFSAKVEVQVGMKFDTTGPDGNPVTVRVIEFDDNTVTLDGNHPLAGVALNFDMRVIDVQDDTSDKRDLLAEDENEGFEESDDAGAETPAPKKRREDLH